MLSRSLSRFFIAIVLACSLYWGVNKGSFYAYAENEISMFFDISEPVLVQDQLTGEMAIINSSGEYLVSFTTDGLNLFKLGENIFCIQRINDIGNQTYALCNADRTLTAFDFTDIQTIPAGSNPILATNSDYQTGYIDRIGQWIIPPIFYYAEPFSEGVALVQTKDNLGYIDQQGEWHLKYTYDDISAAASFSEGVATVKYKTGLWGFIDARGERIMNDCYVDANSFRCGFARVSDGEGYYFIDHHGNVLCDTRFRNARDFVFGYAIVTDESETCGVVSTSGKLIFPTNANSIINITPDHFCWIRTDDSTQYGLYNLDQESFVCSDMYETPFEEGFIWNEEGFIVKKNGLFGFLSKEGSLLLPCQYGFLGMNDEGTLLEFSGERYLYFHPEQNHTTLQ